MWDPDKPGHTTNNSTSTENLDGRPCTDKRNSELVCIRGPSAVALRVSRLATEYGVSWIGRREPCLRAGAGICRPRRSRGSLYRWEQSVHARGDGRSVTGGAVRQPGVGFALLRWTPALGRTGAAFWWSNDQRSGESWRRDLDLAAVSVALGRSCGDALRVRGLRKDDADGEPATGHRTCTDVGLVGGSDGSDDG